MTEESTTSQADSLEYWTRQLAGFTGRCGFPPSFCVLQGQRSSEGTCELLVDAESYQAMTALCGGTSHGYYVVLAAQLILLLRLYASSRDVIVGVPLGAGPTSGAGALLPLRILLEDAQTFEGLLGAVKRGIVDALSHARSDFDEVAHRLGIPVPPEGSAFCDVALMLEELHGEPRRPTASVVFNAKRAHGHLSISVRFDVARYEEAFIKQIARHYDHVIKVTLADRSLRVGAVRVMSDDESLEIVASSRPLRSAFPREQALGGLFAEQVIRRGDHPAIAIAGTQVSYEELDSRANRLAAFLCSRLAVKQGEPVGVLLGRSPLQIEAIMGILAAGCCYVPLDPTWPEVRIRKVIDEARLACIVFEKRLVRSMNRLLWECESLASCVCLDSEDVLSEQESEKNELMDEKLWRHVAETSRDRIDEGGWKSSYTGEPLTAREVEECTENAVSKVEPLLTPASRVLEIGCASGFCMYRIAPRVAHYLGTDLSEVIIERNRERVLAEGHANIEVKQLAAHELGRLGTEGFDLVLMNSVVQCFHGHNYLRAVLRAAIDKLRECGTVFIGDIMDGDLKDVLIADLMAFKADNIGRGYTTKTDFSSELFLSRGFFEDLRCDWPEVMDVRFSRKTHTIANELTRYRYDVVMTIDKSAKGGRAPTGKRKRHYDKRSLAAGSDPRPDRRIGPDDPAYIMFTSGTTGQPKGVVVPHRAVSRVVCNTNYIQFLPEDRVLQWSNYAFDGSVFDIFGALLNGATLVIPGAARVFSVEEVRETIERERATVSFFTTSMFNAIVDADVDALRPLRKIVFGGEEASVSHVCRALAALGPGKLVNGYGPTESTVFAAAWSVDRVDERLGTIPIGQPVSNTIVMVLDEAMRPVPDGVVGEIFIGGEGLAHGYVHDAALTALKFVPDPFAKGEVLYRTGDLGKRHSDGSILFVARRDDQVKLRGFRIELGEVRTAMRAYPGVKEAVVVMNGSGLERTLCGYYSSTEATSAEEMRKFLLRWLPEPMVPAFLVRLEHFPYNRNGKIDLRSLPPATTGRQTGGAPQTALQARVLEIWAEVLKTTNESIGIDDDFFDLGGHSLKATLLVTRLGEKLGVGVPLGAIFSHPTVRKLTEYIEGEGGVHFVPIPRCSGNTRCELSPEQTRYYDLQQQDPTNVSNNAPWAWDVDGLLDVSRLRRALQGLIERHAILRTRFVRVDGRPSQMVEQRAPTLEIQVGELSSEDEVPHAVREFIRPFDLSRAPVFRASVAKVRANRHLLMIDLHHIVCDGTSIGIIFRELSALYNDQVLLGEPVQYHDFVNWFQKASTSPELMTQRDYWKERMRGVRPLNLPTDFERPATQSYDGETLKRHLSSYAYDGLRRLARDAGASLHMVLLAIYGVLLHERGGDEDLVVGSPVAARRHPDLQNTVGLLINMVGIRMWPRASRRFDDFLYEVKESMLEALDNQEYRYERLKRDLSEYWDPARNPLFDTVFVHQNVDVGKLELEGATCTPRGIEFGISRIDLFLQALELGNTLELRLEYATRLFRRSTAEGILDDMQALVDEVILGKSETIEVIRARLRHRRRENGEACRG